MYIYWLVLSCRSSYDNGSSTYVSRVNEQATSEMGETPINSTQLNSSLL